MDSPTPSLRPVEPRAPWWRTIGILAIAVIVVAAAVWIVPNLVGQQTSPAPSTGASAVALGASPSPASQPVATPAPTAILSLPPAAAGPNASLPAGRTLASAGAVAVVGNDGSLSLVDVRGHTIVLAPAGEATFAFPAWSPDGSRLAAIRVDASGTAILIFDARAALKGEAVQPKTIFRSAVIHPFYAAWTPDGQRVSFLADEPDVLSLRLAPADGSAPLDGSAPGSKLRSGNPLYFDWIGNDRILAHVGTGADAFLGEIGLDGSPVGPELAAPGDFRSAVANGDGTLISYVMAAASGPAAVVVSGRDGSNAHRMPVFGTAGMTFNPAGDTVASIGAAAAGGPAFTIPLGPVRLLDAARGTVRTVLDGNVASFWWSPDGKTIAAIRVQPIAATAGASAAPSPSGANPTRSPAGTSASPSSGGPTPAPSQPPSEVRLLFVDVASGTIQSQSVVEPGRLFIDQFMTYFDQYALSHQLWAPDSSAILLPVADAAGTTTISVVPRNGDKPLTLNGAIAFWSP
jgi:TolB protein